MKLTTRKRTDPSLAAPVFYDSDDPLRNKTVIRASNVEYFVYFQFSCSNLAWAHQLLSVEISWKFRPLGIEGSIYRP